jgi:predicted kinase
MADAFLRPSPPCLIAIGGLSGSGKSTIASALASSLGAAPGALVLRSDEIRKQLFGVGRLDRLGTDAYAPAVSDIVYQTLVDNAAVTVRNGHAAIVDAVWLQPEWRRAIEETARQAGVAFIGFWLDAPEPALVQRLEGRRNDPSDADVGVLHLQRRSETGAITWNVVDASGPRDTVVRPIRAELRRRLPAVANGILLGNAK